LIKAGEFHCTKKDAEKFLYEIKDKKENAPMKGDPQKLLYWMYEFLPHPLWARGSFAVT
jgi:hypothetical protein